MNGAIIHTHLNRQRPPVEGLKNKRLHVVTLFFWLAPKRTLQNAIAHCESSSSGVGVLLVSPTAVTELDKSTHTRKKKMIVLEITFDVCSFLCKLRQNVRHKCP